MKLWGSAGGEVERENMVWNNLGVKLKMCGNLILVNSVDTNFSARNVSDPQAECMDELKIRLY